MTVRRLAAALVAAVWLAPTALVGGVALHVAFEHAHHGGEDGRGGGAPVAALIEHGHAHAGEPGEHEHVVALSEDVAARRAPAAATPPAPAGTSSTPGLPSAAELAAAPPPAPPPRAAGSPLLALLSTLRI